MHTQYQYRHQLILSSSSSSTNYHHLIFIFLLLFLCFNSNNNLITFSSAQNDYTNDGYTKCGNPFRCGNIRASFPYWGENRPSYCGHPGLELSCSEDITLIKDMASQRYRVMDINNETQILKLARNDILDGICPTVPSSIDKLIFETTASANRDLSLYDCPTLPSSTIPGILKFTCSESGVSRDFYYFEPNTGAEYIGSCTVRFTVPVLLSSISDGFFNNQSVNGVLNKGFQLRWTISSTELCRNCTESRGQCGYNKDSSRFVCFCSDGLPHETDCLSPVTTLEPAVTPSEPNNSRRKILKILIGSISAVTGTVVVASFLFILIRSLRKKSSSSYNNDNQNIETFVRNYISLAPKRFKYKDVKKMTNSFKEKLGRGGYGSVFKGQLDDGRLVAVKVLVIKSEGNNNGEEFMNEVASISRTSHVNIVTLLGFCLERNKRALIYEFMPNGSLEKFIHGEKLPSESGLTLGWDSLYQVAIGIAHGLEYLHRGCSTRILHFDIKPHNILLDADFRPKISDFGLAKLCPGAESIISMLGTRGTAGYIAPEVFNRNFGGVSHKSDVYSYGMMVLEMVGRRKNIDVKVGMDHSSQLYFPHWIYDRLKSDKSLGLHEIMTEEREKAAKKMIIVGLWCVQTNPLVRPSMSRVLEMLEGGVEPLEIPPKPYLCSPPRSPPRPTDSSTISIS